MNFKKLNQFMDDAFVQIELPLQGDFVNYGLKTISQKVRDDFELLKTQMNKPKWNIEKKSIFSLAKGLNKKQIKEFKNNIICENNSEIPKSYIDFLKLHNGLTITNTMTIFGHYGYDGPSIYFQRMESFPTFIPKNCLNIGNYNPDRSPIFMNPKGNILVFSGTYLFAKENNGKVGEAKKALIGYWNTLEEFIYDEVTRYTNIFIHQPYIFPSVDMLPNHITPEVFDQLKKDKKID